MFNQNIRIFLFSLTVVLVFILLKNGQIFDLGLVFRSTFVPNKPVNDLLYKSDDLSEKYQRLLAENGQLQALAKENSELRQLLDFRDKREYSLELASVIGRDPVDTNILLISIADTSRLRKGQAVVVNKGIHIGTIIELSTESAKVRLLSDNFSKIAVNVGQDQAVPGLMSGSLGLGMYLSFVQQEHDIKTGDLVYTSDVDSLIPSGLVIGQIEEVTFSEEEIFKSAAVSPLIDYSTIAIVAVITEL